MRIRQVKPAFWADEPCSRLSDGARLFYIGLWMLADDAGWLEWNVSEISAELYRYRSRNVRERAVLRFADAISALNGVNGPRLVIFECGHAHLPHLTEHQHLGGRPVFTHKDTHARDCARMIADDRSGKVRVGKVSNGSGDKSPTDLPTPILESLQRHGRLAVGE